MMYRTTSIKMPTRSHQVVISFPLQTAWSNRSLTKLIIINHHSTRNTWEHYCFNTHLNVFFLLTSAPLQFENRFLNTTMALSSKIKRATRMCILRRYHLPAVATCAMKSLISGREFLHGDDTHREMQIELHIEFKSDEDAERCPIMATISSYLLRNLTPYSKKTEGANFEKPPPFNGGKCKST